MNADLLDGHAHVHHPGAADVTTTLVLLHGTGGDEHQLVDLGRLLAPGAGLLGVRGNVVEGGTTTRWFRRLGEGVFDEADVAARTDALAAFLGAAVEAYGLDPTGVVVVGFSNGANTGAALLLRHPDVVRAGVLVSAVQPLDPAHLQDGVPDLSGHAVLMVQGRVDAYAPVQRAEALAALLADAGASVEVVWHDDGHALGRAQADAAAAWLRRYMSATAASPGTSPA